MLKRIVLCIGLLAIVVLCYCYVDNLVSKPVPKTEVYVVFLPLEVPKAEEPTTVSTNEIIESSSITIDEYELDLLAHLIFAEAGSDWCEDEMQLYTGSVALNRVKHAEYPDTLYDVIYQEGQYSCVDNGMIEYVYNERAYECAKFLLTNGSQLPDNVVFQAPFEQGDGTYKQVQNMYFCYIEEGEE